MIYPWQPVIFSWVWTLPNWMDFHRKLSSFGGYFRRVQRCPRQSNSSRQFAWVTIFIKFWFLWVCLHRTIKLRGVEQRFASAGVVLVGGSFWKPRVFKKNIGFFLKPYEFFGFGGTRYTYTCVIFKYIYVYRYMYIYFIDICVSYVYVLNIFMYIDICVSYVYVLFMWWWYIMYLCAVYLYAISIL